MKRRGSLFSRMAFKLKVSASAPSSELFFTTSHCCWCNQFTEDLSIVFLLIHQEVVAARSNVSANHLLYLFVDRVMVVRDVSDTAYVCMCVCGW